MNSTAQKINWTEVTLYSEGQSTNDRETVANAMREYRDNGTVTGYFLDANETPEGGPSVEEIDFTELE